MLRKQTLFVLIKSMGGGLQKVDQVYLLYKRKSAYIIISYCTSSFNTGIGLLALRQSVPNEPQTQTYGPILSNKNVPVALHSNIYAQYGLVHDNDIITAWGHHTALMWQPIM